MKYKVFFLFCLFIRKCDSDDLINTYLKINYEAKANTEMLVHSNYTMHDKGKALPLQTRTEYRGKEVSLHSLLTLPLKHGSA
jgi:hypothetical protein